MRFPMAGIWVTLTLALTACLHGEGEVSTGKSGTSLNNGGDPIMATFATGKELAIAAVKHAAPASLGSSVSDNDRAFYATHRTDLLGELQLSALIWKDDNPSTFGDAAACGVTGAMPQADIYLSFHVCRDIDKIDDPKVAARWLLQLTMLHVGMGNGDRAKALAGAIMAAVD